MSTQNNQTDNTVNDQQYEEVDYADPESPTLEIQRLASPTTGNTERPTDDFNLADYIDKPLPGMIPTPAEEALKLALKSAHSIRAGEQRLSWDGTLLNDDEVMVYSLSHPPIKRRRLDLGELMVKTTSSAKPISDKRRTLSLCLTT